ncbi:unnamed protein product [[Actinomadura] parvosata subsp. kistnae]|nr:unnamed protein product [Actinomadura parvosata subsp. kistnae]
MALDGWRRAERRVRGWRLCGRGSHGDRDDLRAVGQSQAGEQQIDRGQRHGHDVGGPGVLGDEHMMSLAIMAGDALLWAGDRDAAAR